MSKHIGCISRGLMICLASLAILAASAFPAAQPALSSSDANETADSMSGQDPIRASEAGTPDGSGADKYLDDAQPESAKPTSQPAVQGSWCGSMDDNHFGAANIGMDINQRSSKLSGTWTSSLGRSGTFKGKIAGGALTLTLQEKGNACRAAVNGTLVETGEITGTYTVFGCHQSDGGTFDMTSPGC